MLSVKITRPDGGLIYEYIMGPVTAPWYISEAPNGELWVVGLPAAITGEWKIEIEPIRLDEEAL